MMTKLNPAARDKRPASRPDSELASPNAGKGKCPARVLTVDDSEMIQTMYRLVLRHYEGCQTQSAFNGREALEKLGGDNFDLILLDVNMPVMGGIEFLQSFHAQGQKPPAPVIVVSTEGRDDDVQRAMELGATAYLIKPFKSSSLYQIIESVM